MNETATNDPARVNDEDIWDALAGFEKILEELPNDRVALEALTSAYEQIGDHATAKTYLVRLVHALLAENDVASAVMLVERLRAYAEYDAEVSELVQRLEDRKDGAAAEAVPTGSGARAAQTTASGTQGVRSSFSIAAEMSMAWSLMKAGELTQEQYALVVEDLTELSGQHPGQPVSTLHVLEAHDGVPLDKIMAVLAGDSGTPFVSMDSFDFSLDAARLLPLDFVINRGAMVFELLGPDALVAILNPYDETLRDDVRTMLGKDGHFYLVLPSEFDRRVERLRDALADAE